jgi:hypothetical protein
LQPQQLPTALDDDVEPAGTSEAETEDDLPEAGDEADDDVEIDPDLVRPAD